MRDVVAGEARYDVVIDVRTLCLVVCAVHCVIRRVLGVSICRTHEC